MKIISALLVLSIVGNLYAQGREDRNGEYVHIKGPRGVVTEPKPTPTNTPQNTKPGNTDKPDKPAPKPSNTPPPTPPEVVDCRKFVEGINRKYGIWNETNNFCPDKGSDKVLEVKDDIESCIEFHVEKTSLRNQLMTKCISPKLRQEVKERTNFVQCLVDTKFLNAYELPLELCKDSKMSEYLKNEDYLTCLSTYKEIYPGQYIGTTIKECKSNKNMENVTSESFKSCRETLKQLGATFADRNVYCFKSANRAEKNMAELKSCDSKSKRVVGNYLSIKYCMDTELPFKLFTDKAMDCAKESNKYLVDDFYAEQEKTHSSLKFFENMVKSCQNPKPAAIPQNPNLKFLGAKFFQNAWFYRDTKIGGLSGIDYDAKNNTYVVISDDPGFRQHSRMYDMSVSLKNGLEVDPVYLTEIGTYSKKRYYDIDGEAVVITPEGNFILSMETLVGESKSFHKVYDENGDIMDEIYVGDKFIPKDAQVEKTRTYTDRVWVNSNNPYGGYYKDKERTEKFWVTEQVRGIQLNKSFESLTGNNEGTLLYTANEAPLVQDKIKDRKVVRLVKIMKNDKAALRAKAVAEGKDPKEVRSYGVVSEYAYELDEGGLDNGIVDMIYLSENKILTLERNYDAAKDKVTSQIFEVDLTDAVDYKDIESFSAEIKKAETEKREFEVKAVTKKLLVNMDDIFLNLPEGLRIVDNFEGMAIGPKLENGNDSILLVSDNNFSITQFTQFVVLEYDQKASKDMKKKSR